MLKRLLYLMLVVFTACKPGVQEEKRLYPSKIVLGPTTHNFLYDQGRIYSVTTTRPNYYEEVTYRYHDEYFKDPGHKFKDEIFEVNYYPDSGPRGLGGSDSVMRKQEILMRRAETGEITGEIQNVYLVSLSTRDHIRHKYNLQNRLTESIYYYYDPSSWNRDSLQLLEQKYISKRAKYKYDASDRLVAASLHAPSSKVPYLQVELEYDDKPGYLKYLPLEARFLPLELPYRDHNITSYIIKDRYGKVRKDLSYTCTYSYNKDGYPKEFTRKMLDGKEVKGYIVYKTQVGDKSSSGLASR